MRFRAESLGGFMSLNAPGKGAPRCASSFHKGRPDRLVRGILIRVSASYKCNRQAVTHGLSLLSSYRFRLNTNL
jgi:hypothetical protein